MEKFNLFSSWKFSSFFLRSLMNGERDREPRQRRTNPQKGNLKTRTKWIGDGKMWNSFYGRFDESFFGAYSSCLTSFLRLGHVINGSQDQANKYFLGEFQEIFQDFPLDDLGKVNIVTSDLEWSIKFTSLKPSNTFQTPLLKPSSSSINYNLNYSLN